jgi:hypothetical protein
MDGTGTTRDGGGPSEFSEFHKNLPLVQNHVVLTPDMFTKGLEDDGKSRF